MPLPLLGIGAALLVGGAIGYTAAKYWKEIKKWGKIFWNQIKSFVSGVVVGYVKILQDQYGIKKEVIIYEKREKGEYIKHTESESIDESEIPSDILEELEEKNEVKKKLKLET